MGMQHKFAPQHIVVPKCAFWSPNQATATCECNNRNMTGSSSCFQFVGILTYADSNTQCTGMYSRRTNQLMDHGILEKAKCLSHPGIATHQSDFQPVLVYASNILLCSFTGQSQTPQKLNIFSDPVVCKLLKPTVHSSFSLKLLFCCSLLLACSEPAPKSPTSQKRLQGCDKVSHWCFKLHFVSRHHL